MKISKSVQRDAWETLLIFMLILVALSVTAHFAIVRLVPTSIYVGALMISPAIAALVTQKIRGRKISDLPWRWGNWSDNIRAYCLPIIYIGVAYASIWAFGLGGMGDSETIAEWSSELGIGDVAPWVAISLMILLLATVQFVKALGTIVGEELGWRGFLIWELRKIMPFGAVSIVSGLIWAAWHYPIVLTYGGGDPLFQVACFTLMITSMSVIMAYYTFKTASLWPAVIFHTAHNIYIQKIFTPLTVKIEGTNMWIDEYGLMVPIIVTIMAIFYWRKAKAEGM